MTFKVSLSERFWTQVLGEVQGEKGERCPFKFRAQFKRLPQSELRDYATRSRDAMTAAAENGDSTAVAVTFLMEVMTDWADIIDEDNKPLPFNAENLTTLVDMGIGGSIYTAFYNSLPKAREKN